MRIGILIPPLSSLGNPGNGIKAQAVFQSNSLEQLGFEVVKLNPWEWHNFCEFDVIHFFLGGLAFSGIECLVNKNFRGILVFSPIIDSNQSFLSYRLASWLGNVFSRIYTVPGVFRTQAQFSDLIICRSSHERDRIRYGLGIQDSKIRIVLNGAEVRQVSSEFRESVRAKYGLPDEFILHVSAYTQERKNVIRLAEQVVALGYPLVIAGAAQPGVVLEKLKSLACTNPNLHLLGFLDRQELDALNAMCKVFCLPSSHEGTGLVALDAAAHGAHIVITRNGGPLDYFGKHAEYVNPDDSRDIRSAVARAWHKPANTALSEQIQRKLTWRHSAEALVSAYESCLADKRRIQAF